MISIIIIIISIRIFSITSIISIISIISTISIIIGRRRKGEQMGSALMGSLQNSVTCQGFIPPVSRLPPTYL